LIFLSPAKVNLTLQIIGVDKKDGYHFIKSIFDPIALYDILEINTTKAPGIVLKDKLKKLRIAPGENTIYKAVKKFMGHTGMKAGVKIDFYKHIPEGAGLGGGSSNAGAVLFALNRITGAGFSNGDLAAMAAEIGSDVPFFIYRKPAVVSGKGEKIEIIKGARKLWYVLVYDNIKVSTKDAYRLYDKFYAGEYKLTARFDYNKILLDYMKGSRMSGGILYNDFEKVVFLKYKNLFSIILFFLQHGCVDTGLSGSGSTIFAVYEDRKAAFKCFNAAKRQFKNSKVFLTHSI
jgi:4-diphosphocytidyl-2-C-methyl-D-erythritol kinase